MVVPFVVEENVLIYSANQMTLSLGNLQSKLKTKNLLENYTVILIIVSVILGSVSLIGAQKVQKYLGLETKRKSESGLTEESQLMENYELSRIMQEGDPSTAGTQGNTRIGQYRKTSAELLAETCSPDVTLSEKVGDDSDGETLEL